MAEERSLVTIPDNLGFGDLKADDLSIPLISIENGSRWLNENVEGLRKGSIFNSSTGQVWNDGLPFLPVYIQHVHVEWVPRELGGGKVATHSHEWAMRERTGVFPKFKIGQNDLVETWYLYMLIEDEKLVCFPITSMKIAPFKGWATMLSAYRETLPNGQKRSRALCSHPTILKTKLESQRNYKFWNIEFHPQNHTLDNSLLAYDDPMHEKAAHLSVTISEFSRNHKELDSALTVGEPIVEVMSDEDDLPF